MAQRIQGSDCRDYGSVDLFSRFSGRLRTLHARLQVDLVCRIDITEPLMGFTIHDTAPKERHWVAHDAWIEMLEETRKDVVFSVPDQDQTARTGHARSPTYPNAPTSPLQDTGESAPSSQKEQYQSGQYLDVSQRHQIPDPPLSDDDLFLISQALINPDFTNLDRVLNYDDMLLNGNADESLAWTAV